MKKITKYIFTMIAVICLFFLGGVIADKQLLQESVVRLHVIANSDSREDQANKLLVKDAIVAYLQPKVQQLTDKEQAMDSLRQELTELEKLANAVLEKAGSSDRATVTLAKTEFDTRNYETFSLPAGIYDALQVQIGLAEGKNWWCVVFPSLCLPATSEDFSATAAASGFDDRVTNTLISENGYEIRFFFLDCIGKLENFFANC